MHVVTVSDTRTEETDTSGRLAKELLVAAGHSITGYTILRDEPADVAALVRRIAAEGTADAVITSGGTGVSSRDSTIEAIASLLDKKLDGFGELFRMLSFAEIGSAAMLSRAVAGLHGGVIVFATPGSSGAVRLALEKLILPELGHLVLALRCDGAELRRLAAAHARGRDRERLDRSCDAPGQPHAQRDEGQRASGTQQQQAPSRDGDALVVEQVAGKAGAVGVVTQQLAALRQRQGIDRLRPLRAWRERGGQP